MAYTKPKMFTNLPFTEKVLVTETEDTTRDHTQNSEAQIQSDLAGQMSREGEKDYQVPSLLLYPHPHIAKERSGFSNYPRKQIT